MKIYANDVHYTMDKDIGIIKVC